MRYRVVPSTGESVSVLAFGAMRLPQKKDSIDRTAARAMIDYALDNGVNFIDTAWPYHMGESEPFLGEVLESRDRNSYYIMSKLPSWLIEKKDDMDSFLDKQLERLKTDYIDYYLLHALDRKLWDKLSAVHVLEFLDNAKSSGRIRHAGFSFHGDYDTFVEIVDAYQWDACLLQYNYLDEECQAGTKGVRYAASKGIAVFVMEPLRGGLLAAKPPDDVASIFSTAQHPRSNVAWALDWIWDHGDVVSVLSGMSSIEQVKENCALADNAEVGMMGTSEQKTLRDAAQTFRQLLKVPCTGCMYCVPCPQGVDIPICFEFYNYRHTFGGRDARRRYNLWLGGKQPTMASLCTSCGACLSHCPQSIDIPAELVRVRRYFEGPKKPSRRWGVKRPCAMHRWAKIRMANI